MHLIKNDITRIANGVITEFCKLYNIRAQELFEVERLSRQFTGEALRDYSFALDFAATGWIAEQTQTFIFDADQVLAFISAIDHRLPPGDYPTPFEYACVQFSRGIDERLFTTGLRSSGNVEPADEILGLLIAAPNYSDNPAHQFMNVVAWYKSTSINSVQVPVAGDGEIEYRPLDDTIAENRDALYQDKQRLVNLAMLCLAYLDSPSVETERVSTDPAVNRRRAAKGKKPLEDYYVCTVRHEHTAEEAPSLPSGQHVSFMFPVRGHSRHLSGGRVIRIKAHFRGLEHGEESMRPKVYEVE